MTDKKILYDSSKSAWPHTMTGWASAKGHFYKDESVARYDGCTHNYCKCGNEKKRDYSLCESCEHTREQEMYNAMPYVDYDGVTPLVIFRSDQYFMSYDDLYKLLPI